jgi:type II secretory ATPase GspE/PulE/Tfp pilus assembly ATPase PilB-like protein
LRSLLALREGLILVTGPTGSGKTTTLYSALCEISSPQINVVTLEDPVEHEFLHMNQAQVNPVAGFDFATGLRAILRQDPNVILVGEIRDEETAAVAIQASMTGHLVLSTVHANSAAHAPLRLVNMGVEPYLVAHALQGTLAQRLVRRLCTGCRRASPTADMPGAFEAGPGCDRCIEGYRGRLALCEVISVDDAIRQAITDGASGARISELAASGGYRPLRTLARERVRVGATSMGEVIRVIGS